MPNSRSICLGFSNVVVWPIGRDWGWGWLVLGRYLRVGWEEIGVRLRRAGNPFPCLLRAQPNPNLLSLLSLQIHINSDGVRVWDWGVRKQWRVEENYWLTRMLPLPGQPFFFLLSHELRDEQCKKKWLRNNLASECHQFVIRPLNSGLRALKKKEERRSLRPLFWYIKASFMVLFINYEHFCWFQGTSLMLLSDTGVRTKTEVCQVKM